MSDLGNHLFIQGKCSEIAEAIHGTETQHLYHHGDVYVLVLTGDHAASQVAFMKAITDYLDQVKYNKDEADPKGERADLNAALDLYMSRLGY